jgi:hypothetical protein
MALKVIYWVSTILAAVMLGFTLSYLSGNEPVVSGFQHLGYPQHLRLVLGVAKPAAGVVILLPGLRLLKEWAYAGAAFAWSMAFIAHWQAGDGATAFMPLALLAFLIVSYLTRPASRRITAPAA